MDSRRAKRRRTAAATSSSAPTAAAAGAPTVEVSLGSDDVTLARSEAMRQLFEAGDLCDGEVEMAGGRNVPVSRFALAAASTFFRGAFAGGMREGAAGAVKLDPSLDPECVEALLRFAHAPGFTCNVDPEAFVVAVDQLGFLELLPKVASILAATMDPSNCLARLVLANRHGAALSPVLERGVEVLSEHAGDICASPTYAQLPQDLLATILAHDKCTADETALYEGLVAWRAHDAARHGAPFDALLELLRLPSLGLEYLIANVMHADEIFSSARAKTLVQEAVAFLTVPARRAALTSTRTAPRCRLSEILSRDEIPIVTGWLPGPDRGLKLLFRASRDGWMAADFQRCCGAGQHTVVVARSASNHVFGGYSDVAWAGRGGYKRSEAAFLFAIRAFGASEPAKLPPVQGSNKYKYAICLDGPCCAFGGGYDLSICEDANVVKASYANLGFSFANPRAVQPWDKDYFTGEENFLLADWEVFEVVAS